jgi:hypothetical protein
MATWLGSNGIGVTQLRRLSGVSIPLLTFAEYDTKILIDLLSFAMVLVYNRSQSRRNFDIHPLAYPSHSGVAVVHLQDLFIPGLLNVHIVLCRVLCLAAPHFLVVRIHASCTVLTT